MLKKLAKWVPLVLVLGMVLTMTGCDGNVYVGVTASPWGYGYPYGGVYSHGGYGGGVYVGRPWP